MACLRHILINVFLVVFMKMEVDHIIGIVRVGSYGRSGRRLFSRLEPYRKSGVEAKLEGI